MAYLEARAGIARAGVTYGGWAAPRFTITVGGTVRTTEVLRDGFALQRALNAPGATMRFRATDWTPVPGQRVAVQYCTPNETWFGGFVARRTMRVQAGVPTIYDCEVVSDVWLMDFLRPYGRVHATGLRPALEWLLGRFTDGNPDFTVGSVPSTTADIAETLLDGSRTVSQVITDWVTQTDGAYWRLCPVRRAVDVFLVSSLPDSNGDTLIDNSAVSQLVVQHDIAQVATRVRCVNGGSQITATASLGATVIPVEDCSQFLSTVPAGSGTVAYALYSPHGTQGYTGTTAASGAGSLTAPSIDEEYPQGMTVRHGIAVTDTAASEALSLVMDAHSSAGIAERWLADDAAKADACMARATGYLSQSGSATATLRYLTTNRWVTPGQAVIANITTPETVAGTFVVASVVTTPRGRGTATRADVWHEVTAVQIDRTMWARLFYSIPPTPAAAIVATYPINTMPPGFLPPGVA